MFNHVLSDLTIAVDPEYQGRGLGNRLFQTLLDHVTEERKDILRVELIAENPVPGLSGYTGNWVFKLKADWRSAFIVSVVWKLTFPWPGSMKDLILRHLETSFSRVVSFP